MRKLLASFFIVLLFISSSLFARELNEILKDKKIKVAVDTTYPPMEFEATDGKVIGLDIDLARELSRELKLEVEFIVMPWDGILAGLASNRYDIIMSSMNITEERKRQVDFIPYISMGQIFVTRINKKKVASEKDLEGRIVAVQADTTSYTALEAMKNSGIKMKDIKAFKGATEAFSAVKANQAEVILIDEAVGLYYAGLDSKTFVVTGNAMKPEPIGIAVRKTDKELKKAIERAMKTIKDNGKFKKIYRSWLNTDPK